MVLRNAKGMTLTEVLSAMAILGIVVVLFSNISGYSALALKRSSDIVDLRSIAEKQLHIARDRIEKTGVVPTDEVIDGTVVSYRVNAVPDGVMATDSNGAESAMQAVVLLEGQPQWLTVTVTRIEGD